MEELKRKIESSKTLIVIEFSNQGDLFNNPLTYVVGDFSIAHLPNYQNLEEIISAINPHADISIGIGFELYCHNLRSGIISTRNTGKSNSFVISLWDEVNTHTFIVSINKNDENMVMTFFYLNNSTLSITMDNLVANNFKDQLTGLFNRKTMVEHIEKNNHDGYLCLFDLNKFKEINDTYGHEVGDDVLVLTGQHLIDISSMDEVFYRRSGDEFMILFLKHDLDYAISLINKINNYLLSLSNTALKNYKDIVCSASFGLLELKYPKDEEKISVRNELNLTDLAMYQAKASNKLYHLISYDDALSIIEKGDLDERLNKIAISLKR